MDGKRKYIRAIQNFLCDALLKNSMIKCQYAEIEYPVWSGNGCCKVDVFGTPYVDVPPFAIKGKINKGIGIEFKSNHTDFNTGYGQNFDFQYNLFCTFPNMMEYALKFLNKQPLKYFGIGLIIFNPISLEFKTIRPALNKQFPTFTYGIV